MDGNGSKWTEVDWIGPMLAEINRTGMLMWLNRSVAKINTTLQLLDIIIQMTWSLELNPYFLWFLLKGKEKVLISNFLKTLKKKSK